MSLSIIGITLGYWLHALFQCVLTMLMVVLVDWIMAFSYQQESSANVIFCVFHVRVNKSQAKGGRLMEIFWRSNSWFFLHISKSFYSYSHGLTLSHSFLPLLIHKKHGRACSNGIHPLYFESWYLEYQGHCFHPMCWWSGAPDTWIGVSGFGKHHLQIFSYSVIRGHCWNRWRVCEKLPCWKWTQNPDHWSTFHQRQRLIFGCSRPIL